MIRIAITAEAYLAICATLPLGSVMYEPEVNANGERQIWLEPAAADKLARLRGPDESFSDVILRLAAAEHGVLSALDDDNLTWTTCARP
jgi:hypothetical protein